jgi:Arc/MetJ-type ribon-helix-helix transcriptional regulator
LSVKITIRIPKELKRRMERFKNINWSEVVRKAIEEKIYEEEVKEALKIMDEISSKAKPKEPTNEIIRRFRDERR